MFSSESQNAYKLGLTLGLTARIFGARAPLQDIARKLLHEILRPQSTEVYKHTDYEPAKNMFNDAKGRRGADGGIDIAIIDWWLRDEEFVRSVEDRCEWADCKGQEIDELWLADPRYDEKMEELERVVEKAVW